MPSGSAVPLPQFAPYTDPLQIMICGGSSPAGIALDNCVTIAPESANPIWTLERMVVLLLRLCSFKMLNLFSLSLRNV